MNFIYRLLLLTIILLIFALIDQRLKAAKGLRSERWSEYAFLYCSALIAAVFGVCNDLISSHISPEYFIHGKGIATGDGFTLRVCALGAQAGCAAGFVAAGILLSCRRPPLAIFSLMRYIMYSVVGAAGCGLLGYFILPPFINSGFLDVLHMSENAEIQFIKTWSIHLGLYAGLLGSIIFCCFRIRRSLRTMRSSSHEH